MIAPRELTVRLRDGTDLFYRAWLPDQPADKGLVLFHRGHEHSGRWQETVEALGLTDWAVFAWDQRGHGRSPGARGDALNLATVVADADGESVESLLDRSPRTIRHNYRAVTIEDFQDMAKLASPEVARAKCIPLRDLAGDPLDQSVKVDPLSGLPGLRGRVSVIVVPHSNSPKPLPSL